MSKSKTYNPQKIKAMLAAPLLFIPFATLAFYALGGGSGDGDQKQQEQAKGLNTFLPSPKLKDKEPDKLSLYQMDDKDSADRKHRERGSMNLFDRLEDKRAEADLTEENDSDNPTALGRVSEPFADARRGAGQRRQTRGTSRHRDPADELEEKLAAFQKALEQEPEKPQGLSPVSRTESNEEVIQQLETAMAAIQQNTAQAQPDQELQMMNGMLDKVLDIQNPGRVRDRMEKSQSTSSKGMRVAPGDQRPLVDPLLGATPNITPLPISASPPAQDGFYELNDNGITGENDTKLSIAAVVHGTQRLISGSTIKVRIDQDIYVQHRRLPKGAFIYGKCTLSGERVQIAFSLIRHGQLLLPVKVVAYGLDALPGIPIPGSMTRDAAKQGSNEAIQAITMGSLDPSIGAQATAAGIDAAKTLLTKKVRLVRFTIKADHPILLQDDSMEK